MAPPGLGLLQASLTGGEPYLDEEELVEDEASRSRFETFLVGGEVDAVDGIVQVWQPVAGEDLRRQRIEYTPGLVESAVDKGTHPSGVDALADRIYRHELSGVSVVPHRLRIIYELDILGRDLQSVLALHLARDEDPSVRDELVQ